MQEADIKSNEIDYVAFYDKPFLKFERILESYLAFAPKGIFSFLKAIHSDSLIISAAAVELSQHHVVSLVFRSICHKLCLFNILKNLFCLKGEKKM